MLHWILNGMHYHNLRIPIAFVNRRTLFQICHIEPITQNKADAHVTNCLGNSDYLGLLTGIWLFRKSHKSKHKSLLFPKFSCSTPTVQISAGSLSSSSFLLWAMCFWAPQEQLQHRNFCWWRQSYWMLHLLTELDSGSTCWECNSWI